MSETIKTILTADTGQFQAEFSKAKATIDNYHKAVLSVGAALGGSAILTAAVGKFNAIRNSIDLLNDQAARLELPVEDMQRLNAVATMSGASVESLAKALNKSKLSAVEAAQGSKELAKDFATLGINVKEFIDLSATERILAISKGFNSAADQGAAFSAVFKIMGRGASDLIPLLRDGAAGVDEISRRLQVLGGDDVKAVAKLNDEIDLLSANLNTKMSGAFIALRPQIEGFVSLLSDAADGLATFLDPAGGVGKQGGAFGGAEMLRELDKLKARIDEINAHPARWWEGPLGQQRELKNSIAAVDTLQARYASLDESSKIYAEQLAEVERLRKSGLGEEELRGVVQRMQEGNAERIRAIDAEKQIAAAASTAAGEMEKQTESAATLAKTLESIQGSVGSRIINLQSPEKRKEVASAGLANVLSREKVGSADELRQKIGTTTNGDDKLRMLKSLDEALDRMEEIKRAAADITSGAATKFAAWNASIKDAADTAKASLANDPITNNTEANAERQKAQAAARGAFNADFSAMKLELSGRKESADKLRAEIALRAEAAELSDRLGISEKQSLDLARLKAEALENLNRLRETNQSDEENAGKPQMGTRNPGKITRGQGLHNPGAIRHSEPKQGLDFPKLDFPKLDFPKLDGVGRLQIQGIRTSQIRQRGKERAASGPNVDPNVQSLRDIKQVVESIFNQFSQIGSV